jgi:capsular polysaccharide biosynthesis protein
MVKRLVLGLMRQVFPFPKGTFSLHRQLLEGKVQGGVFITGQSVPEFGSDSLVKRARLGQDRFQPWPVFWAKVDHAKLVGPNLLLMDQNRRACAEGMYTADFKAFDVSYNTPVFGAPVELKGNFTSIVGRMDQGYWHFLMDAVTRLHALSSFPGDARILVRPDPLPWQKDILDMLGVGDRLVEAPSTHLRVEHFYFSSFTSMAGAWNPFGVDFLRKNLLPFGKTTEAGEKLYLKRGDGWTRGIVNEEELCDFMQARGWRVVRPETMTVAEQIGLFQNARAVCSVHGSALTNLLWASSECKVVELCADNFVLGSFEWLARCLGLEHTFLMHKGNARFSIKVDMDRLEKHLMGAGLI